MIRIPFIATLVCLLNACPVLGVLLVEKDAMGRAVQVIVLAAVDGPEKDPNGQRDQNHGDGNQNVKCGQKMPPVTVGQGKPE